jgi:hypothetical protein
MSDELTTLLSDDEQRVTLSTGTVVLLERLRMRQFFRLMRIITHGAGSAIARTTLDVNDTMEHFITQLLMLILFAIPDAEQETIDFLTSMCKPDGLIENRALTKLDRERNATLTAQLHAELDNPNPDDFVILLEAITRREAADLQALGKKLMAMFRMAQKAGVITESSLPDSPDMNSSAAEPGSPTFSPVNTAGPMTSFSDSPFVEPGSASPPSPNAVGTTSVNSGSF